MKLIKNYSFSIYLPGAAEKLQSNIKELIQTDFTDDFDCGEIGITEILPVAIPLNSQVIQDILQETEDKKSDAIKTALYCTKETEEVTTPLWTFNNNQN